MTTFRDLWVGDRFSYAPTEGQWTKLSEETARRHSKASTALGALGYGYLGDTVCSFSREDEVVFLPLVVSKPASKGGGWRALVGSAAFLAIAGASVLAFVVHTQNPSPDAAATVVNPVPESCALPALAGGPPTLGPVELP